MNVLVLQHIACEPPGVFEDVLLERGATLCRVELDEGEPLPASHDGIDAIVAMGGPMSVNDEAEHPWLAAEKALIARAVRDGVPFWGSCLGVQLLASSLGAQVRRGPTPEVGVLPVYPTPAAADDPVFSGLAWPRPTLQWHQDTFDLPEGATLLASSPEYPHQAFRVGRVAYGVQFHVEVDAAMADAWAQGARVRRFGRGRARSRWARPAARRLPGLDGRDAGGRTRPVLPLGRSLGLETAQVPGFSLAPAPICRACQRVERAASPSCGLRSASLLYSGTSSWGMVDASRWSSSTRLPAGSRTYIWMPPSGSSYMALPNVTWSSAPSSFIRR